MGSKIRSLFLSSGDKTEEGGELCSQFQIPFCDRKNVMKHITIHTLYITIYTLSLYLKTNL